MTISLKPTVFFVTAGNNLSTSISQQLLDMGFHVEKFLPGAWSSSQVQTLNPDLVVFDIGESLPKGIAVCKEIRSLYQGPLMVVSDHSDEAVQVLSLEAGADYFLILPVSPRLLLARARALMRRGGWQSSFL